MKALIVSFFGVILGYSLFIDTDKEPKLPVEHSDKVVETPVAEQMQKIDSIDYYASKTRFQQVNSFHIVPF